MDLDCAQPLGHGQTDASGLAAFPVQNPTLISPLGINGYLQLVLPGYVPTLLYWGFPLSEATDDNNWKFVTPAVNQQLAATGGVTLDPMRGQITVRVFDCLPRPAPEVEVTTNITDPKMSEFYGLAFNRTPPTDSSGLVFFNNVPVGPVTLTATPVALGRPSSKVAVSVRAGFDTAVEMWVTP
jgi:hypothetical protein